MSEQDDQHPDPPDPPATDEKVALEKAMGEQFTQAYEAFDKAADALATLVNTVKDNDDLALSFLQFLSEDLAFRAGFLGGIASTELQALPHVIYATLQERTMCGMDKSVHVHTAHCGTGDCPATASTRAFLRAASAAVNAAEQVRESLQKGRPNKPMMH